MSIKEINHEDFISLVEGNIPTGGSAAIYDWALLRRIALNRDKPFNVAMAAATIQAPKTVVTSRLNRWEADGLLVKVPYSGNNNVYFPKGKLPQATQDKYDQNKLDAMLLIAMPDVPSED